MKLSHGLQVKFRVSRQILVEFAIIYHIIYIMRRQKSLSVSFKCFCKTSMINSPNCLKRNPPFLKCPTRYMVHMVIETVDIINLCCLCRWVCTIRSVKVNGTLLIVQKAMLISWGMMCRMITQIYRYIGCTTSYLCHTRCASVGYSCYRTCVTDSEVVTKSSSLLDGFITW